jgi:hypothetical protein
LLLPLSLWHTKLARYHTISAQVSQMIDHKKIEDAIDSYFKNTPTAKIIENLDRHSLDLENRTRREQDEDRDNSTHEKEE